LAIVVRWVKDATGDVPVVIKLSAQDSDIIATALAVERSGADGVCAINTIKSITGVNLDTLIPYPNVAGAEFLLLGASTLQICTAVLRFGIGIIEELRIGLESWMDEKNNAIIWREGRPQVIMSRCIGCGICLAMCSVKAINLVRPSVEN